MEGRRRRSKKRQRPPELIDELSVPNGFRIDRHFVYSRSRTDACLRCQAENRSDKEQEECVVIWGECNHSFHNCCMKLWVKQNNRCPLCQQEWCVSIK